jgi:four helix bundle protein
MAYKSFEELPVWNAAIELAVRVFAMTATGGLNPYAGLKNQIERAVVSVSNNIAEGYERGTRDERVNFLYYALGSAGEVRSMLMLLQRLPDSRSLHSHVDELLPMTKDVSRQLVAWIEATKDSPHRGPRHENTSTRNTRDQTRRRDDFMKHMERIVAESKSNSATDDEDGRPPGPVDDSPALGS